MTAIDDIIRDIMQHGFAFVCNPNRYTGGAGEWLIDPDGSCWYLHTNQEFDEYWNCPVCHDGVQAAEW